MDGHRPAAVEACSHGGGVGVFFVDDHGNECFILNGAAHVAPGTTLPATMRKFLDADGLRNLQSPQDGSWTVPDAMQTLSWLLQHKLKPVPGTA
ncbi:hypothetical protein ABZ746_28395 [Streptomyces sp. NPDC020096]